MPSYHDAMVIVDGIEHRIKDSYAYELICTKVAGWRLFTTWQGKSTLIGGEYDESEFIIKVGGVIVCDNRKEGLRCQKRL